MGTQVTCIDEVGGGTKHAGRGTYDLNKPIAQGLFFNLNFFKLFFINLFFFYTV